MLNLLVVLDGSQWLNHLPHRDQGNSGDTCNLVKPALIGHRDCVCLKTQTRHSRACRRSHCSGGSITIEHDLKVTALLGDRRRIPTVGDVER